jgi:hypothetical protein
MVGVKVGEENGFQPLQWQAAKCRDLGGTGAGINQEQRFSGQNCDASLGAPRGWQR